MELNSCMSRVLEGSYRLLPPSEILAWSKLSGNIVYPVEYDILRSMDEVFCREANLELESIRSKQDEERKRQVEEAQSKRSRFSRKG